MTILGSNIRGIIFDMDGTLLDSMPQWEKAAMEFFEKYEIEADSMDYEHFLKTPAFELGEYIKQKYRINESAQYLAEESERMIEYEYIYNIQPKYHVRDMLKCLKKSGVRMAVATATGRKLAEAALGRCGILNYFSGIATCEEEKAGKDKPTVYFAAMKIINTPIENTVVVEDAYYAVKTAKGAGFFVIGTADDSMKRDRLNIIETADLFIENAGELFPVLTKGSS